MVTVTDSGGAVDEMIAAATEVYSEAYDISAENNGLVNNGMTSDTTVTTTRSDQINSPTAEMKGPELTVKTPQQQLSSQQAQTQARPLQARMAALDARMTRMTLTVTNAVSSKPLTWTQNGWSSCGGKSFTNEYVQGHVKRILDSSKGHGVLDATTVRPMQTEFKR